MRIGSLIFTLLQVPRCRIHSLANYGEEALHGFNKAYGNNSSIRLHGLERGLSSTKLIQRLIATRAERNKQILCNTESKSTTKEEILASATVKVIDQSQKIEYPDVQEIARYENLCDLVTVIVFDLETTGYSKVKERIIEIALRDLRGGENSTFQTLVNPQCHVPNSHVHGISSEMVNGPDVPRMEDLIPILLQYIKSREKHGGYVLLVAHNARTFDAPFLIHEFIRCSTELPCNLLFLDSLPLGREQIKSAGTNLSSASLVSLKEFYKVKVDGSAHRAMVDVNTLSQILPMLTSDLNLSLSDLVRKSFTLSDLMNPKKTKKKNSH